MCSPTISTINPSSSYPNSKAPSYPSLSSSYPSTTSLSHEKWWSVLAIIVPIATHMLAKIALHHRHPGSCICIPPPSCGPPFVVAVTSRHQIDPGRTHTKISDPDSMLPGITLCPRLHAKPSNPTISLTFKFSIIQYVSCHDRRSKTWG